MQIKRLPERERPVEKTCSQGIETLSNPELIALILHTGTRNQSAIGLGEHILASMPEGLSGLGGCTMEDLCSLDGIGPAKASAVLAAVELGKRIAASRAEKGFTIERSTDVADMVMEELRYKKKEHFKSILVNAKGEVITVDEVSVGALSSTVIHPREVFQKAIRKSAAAVIFAHNHPSGDPSPSGEDIQTTGRLVEAGKLLGIEVLDHIVIGDGCFVSMRDMGFIE